MKASPSPDALDTQSSRRAGLPRLVWITLGLVAWLVGMPLVHGVLPWALSSLSPRYGWTDGHPGMWNLLGLTPVAAGVACLVWDFALGLTHVGDIPERMDGITPPFLMTRGPHAFTRNPMYVSELALWLGWAILYGSLVVLLGFVILCVALNVVVPMEERTLEARFGEVYRAYKSRVPRWVGKSR